MEPFLNVDLRLLFQVRSVRCAGLTLHLRVLGQLQLLKALELWDSTERQIRKHNKRKLSWHEDTKMKNIFMESLYCLEICFELMAVYSYSASLTRRKSSCSTTAPEISV